MGLQIIIIMQQKQSKRHEYEALSKPVVHYVQDNILIR